MDLKQQHKHYQLIEKALYYLQLEKNKQPSLAEVAKHCALSEEHFQKIFQQWAGISPKRFLQFLTREHAKKLLLSGSTSLATTLQTGLSSTGRLHDLLITFDAITPGELRQQGKGINIYYGTHPSPFGYCFIATTERGIHTLYFLDKPDDSALVNELKQQWPLAVVSKDQAITLPLIKKIFTPTNNNKKALRLWVNGSRFQLKVWEALLTIPEGTVCSYRDIALAINQPAASRAVGSAIAKNSIALLIPCHRVIQTIGDFGQYRWGSIRKTALLGKELSSTHSMDTLNH